MIDSSVIDAVHGFYSDDLRPLKFALPPDGPGFSAAIVLRVETDAGAFCLRGWPPETTDAQRVRGLHHLLRHLRACGISCVAVPVGARDGRTLIPCRGRWWQLEPWMPGRADFASFPTASRLRAAAACLARLHLAAATFEPTDSEKTSFSSHPCQVAPAVSTRINRIESWTDKRLARLRASLRRAADDEPQFCAAGQTVVRAFERCAPLIARELHAAQQVHVPIQPCLRDVWHDHILFDGDDVSAIVDPSAARADTVAADISRLVGSLVADDRPSWDVALSAYQEVRRLSTDEVVLVGLLDRSGNLLSGMTWLARKFLAGVEFDRPRQVIDRLQRVARRLEVLLRNA